MTCHARTSLCSARQVPETSGVTHRPNLFHTICVYGPKLFADIWVCVAITWEHSAVRCRVVDVRVAISTLIAQSNVWLNRCVSTISKQVRSADIPQGRPVNSFEEDVKHHLLAAVRTQSVRLVTQQAAQTSDNTQVRKVRKKRKSKEEKMFLWIQFGAVSD